jgi:hypothetical protein
LNSGPVLVRQVCLLGKCTWGECHGIWHCLLGRRSYCLNNSANDLCVSVMVFFEIGSHKLFVWH